ncbi:hypothetical protein ES703_26362 [subsurface metagenome]
MVKKRAEIIVFVLVIAVAILLGLNTNRFFYRIDLTENKAFTISRVSRELFQEIPGQVYITYYASDKLRSLYDFPARIEDLLNEYAAYSRGKIKVAVQDPVKAGEIAKAEALGVYPRQIEVVERDERSFAMVYTGLVIQYLDRYETIPVVAGLGSLEYELTTKIRKIVTDEERVVGILSGNASRNIRQDFGSMMANLSTNFTARELERGQDIPAEVSVLLVFGQRDLEEFDLFPIDQFIMKGGKALFAAEGVHIDLQRGLAAGKVEDSALLDMLKNYGVEIKREQLLDRYCQSFKIPRQVFGQIMWEIIGKYPHWITVADQFVSKENPITARFVGLDLYWASPLQLLKRENINVEPLIRTTPEAWTMTDHFETHPERAGALLYMNQENKDQYTIAASLSGSFSSFFKDRSIPTRAGEEREWEEIIPGSAETRIIVVGDADFASEIYQYTDASYNLDFLSNCAEWLSNSEDLLEIKTRVARDMRLNKIREPERRVRAAFFTQLFNMVLIPLLVIILGIFRFFLRYRKSLIVLPEH